MFGIMHAVFFCCFFFLHYFFQILFIIHKGNKGRIVSGRKVCLNRLCFKHQASRSMAEQSALRFHMSKVEFSSDLLKILTKQEQAGSIQIDILAKGKWMSLNCMFLIFNFRSVWKDTLLLDILMKSKLQDVLVHDWSWSVWQLDRAPSPRLMIPF